MSQELWMWAKYQVLSSLRLPFAIGAMLPAVKKAQKICSSGKEVTNDTSSTFPKSNPSCKQDYPMKSSRTHQELHKELLLTYNKGLVLHSKPELLRVLEKRRSQWKEGQEDTKQISSPLEQELQKWQQRREEREHASSIKNDKSGVHEFLRVRENLRKSATRDTENPPSPAS
ncbi:Hypothetical predicted protein [Pelobates cultripes]|uniref:Uncharacterized protein n=1 Tax=Pelobates cultripes TaxID=61616 RepID=A0AAD1WJU9_PELCU|nr:Hypothetical predicted protein [Pelobates cultripes]